MKKLIFSGSSKKINSEFKLHFILKKDFDKKIKEHNLSLDFLKKLKFEETDLTKWAVLHHDPKNSTGYFIFTENRSAFELHESLRKSLPMDLLLESKTTLDFNDLTAEKSEFFLNALGNLFALSQFKPISYGKKAKNSYKSENEIHLTLLCPSLKEAHKKFETGYREGDASNLVRTLSEMPGNELRPEPYLKIVKELLSSYKISQTFLDQKELKKRGANAFLAVVRANPSEPYGILKLHYKPKNAKKRVALVGKGLCFDTGGYNIKTGDHMFDMHRDMTGSAVVLALTKHLIEENINIEIETYMALAENLISPSAYRPNDVVVASNGVSIEVVDTDAEGRMVLADTLVMASREKPDLIIDYATLTGSVIRALGTARSGVYSNVDLLRELAHQSGNEVGERVWGFPIGEDYNKGIESEIADVRQCGKGNFCDHIYASTFLSKFVENNIPWLHVDLASENNAGGLGLSSRDITGFGVRLGKKIIQQFLKV